MKKLILIGLVLIVSLSQAKVEPEKKHQAQLRLLDSFLAHHHYQHAVLDDKKSKEILDNYLEYLDFRKMLLTQKDITDFKRYETLLDDFAHKGELGEVYRMYNQTLTRKQDYIQWVIARLEKPFRDDAKGSIQLDRKKIDWPKNEAALRQRWEKELTNEWLILRLAKKSDVKAREILKKRYKNRLKKVSQFNADDVFELYANAITSVYDPHTAYFSPLDSENFDINMRLSLEGIGAQLGLEEAFVSIKKLIAGGPAKRSGKLSINDKILGVAQGKDGEMVDIVGWRLDDVLKLIRGKRGTTVRLQIQKAMSDQMTEVVLVRDKINLEESAAKSKIKRFEHGGKVYRIGIIELPSFYMDFAAAGRGEKNYRSTTRDVKKLIKKLKKTGIDGLLIDLRNNGGGSLSEAVSLTGLFFGKGPVVQVKRSDGGVQVDEDSDESTFYNGPLGVLTNEYSASASEIFTGAIKDYGRGVILGEPTFGKGSVQTVIDLAKFVPFIKDKVGQLKMTIAMFYRVNGSSTQLKGVVPDIYIPNKASYVAGGERDEKHAMAWQKIKPVKHTFFPWVSPPLVAQLKADYQHKNKNNPLKKNLIELLQWQKKQKDDTLVALSYQKRLARKNRLQDKGLYFQNNFRKVYGYPLLRAQYLDKKENDKSEKEKENDKKYEVDAVLDLSVKTMADYVRLFKMKGF